MNPSEYQKLAERTECDQSKSSIRLAEWKIDRVPVRANHAVVGMTGEVGEIASILQKWLYYGKYDEVEPVDRFDTLRALLSDEAGDLLWYVAQLLNTFGLDMGKVMEANIEKLKIRYPNKYTDYQAEHRDRVAEGVAQGRVCKEKYHDGLEGVE